MVGMGTGITQEEIIKELTDKTVELWGQERAEANRQNLEQTGRNIWVVAQNPPAIEDEPAYFL